MQGYLDKINVGDFSPKWVARYVKLSNRTHLDYFKDDTCASHRGVVYCQGATLSEVDLVDPDASKLGSRAFDTRVHAFKLVDAVTGKTHFFNAESLSRKKKWMAAICEAGAGMALSLIHI